MPMDYAQAQRYILSLTDYEKIPGAFAAANFDPRRMEALLRPLGDPHRSGSFVHIAGSKGKGSTAAMIASALSAAGYRTGLFTSPHLHTIRERIRIGGNLITHGELAALTEKVKPAVEEAGAGPWGIPSTFEVLTAMALLHFRQAGAPWAVLEVGLGGRLDATNVVTPRVAVITSISYDHTEVLGPTLAHIAREKAGIIKPGVPLVLAPQPPDGEEEVLGIIQGVCRERDSSLTRVGRDVTWRLLSAGLEGQRLRVTGRRGRYELAIPLLGEHQQENAATAVAALEWLMDDTPSLSPRAVARGLGAVSWPGRLQVIGREPLIVVDGAHNADSARRLRQAVGSLPYRRVVLVMATSRDKDIAGMVRELAPLHPRVIATHSHHPRALPAGNLAAEWAKYGPSLEVAEDVAGALARARSLAAEEDMVLATGSLFLAAEVLEEMGVAEKEDF